MAAGGVVSRSVIRSDGVVFLINEYTTDATSCPTVRISTQEKMVFESSSESRKSWDGRKMTRQCIPNSRCDRRKGSRGCHGGFAQRNTY